MRHLLLCFDWGVSQDLLGVILDNLGWYRALGRFAHHGRCLYVIIDYKGSSDIGPLSGGLIVLGYRPTAPVKGRSRNFRCILIEMALSGFPNTIRVIFWEVNDGLSVELLPLEYVERAINHCLMKLKWSCQLLMVGL